MLHKYVRSGSLGFFLWPMTDVVTHREIGSNFYDAISAGFVAIDGGKVHCYGRSESMNLDSRLDDSEALAKQLGLS